MGKIIKVGKNQIWEDGGWNIEVFQFMDGKTPMYSFFDVVKTERQARKLAKVLNKNNEAKIHDQLLKNPNYLS